MKLIDEVLNLGAHDGGMPLYNHEVQIAMGVGKQLETTFTK